MRIHRKHQDAQEDPSEVAMFGVQKRAKENNIDDLLDEIDAVLAADAQVFVESFKQKGGQ